MTVHGGMPGDPGGVRAALASIVADPDYGAAALSSSRAMESLLKDLLPDRPRDAAILVAAAEHGLAASLRDRVEREGMDAGVAVRLVAAGFGRATAFTPEACEWAVTELAGALGLDTAARTADPPPPARGEPALVPPAGLSGQAAAPRHRTAMIIAAAGIAAVVIAVPVVLVLLPKAGAVPVITAAASSGTAPGAGEVLVYYQDPGLSSATITGTVSRADRGEVAALTAQPFPFTAVPRVLARTRLAGRNQDLSFLVTPSLETRYRIEVLPSASGTPLATSAARTVYVALVARHAYTKNSCPRPKCYVSLQLTIPVAPAALHAEEAKRIYFYLAIHLAPSGPEPSDPVTLTLRNNRATSPPVTLGRGEYGVDISFSFTVNRDAYRWHWNACTKDDVASDGIGLPGNHLCGHHTIPSAPAGYLGSMSG